MIEEVEVRGHIVDSLLLPKILDRILLMQGTFEIRECKIGVHRTDPSYARIAIRADSHETLGAILGDLIEHGASPIHPEDATIVPADIAGGVSRVVLQHDQPSHPGAVPRALDRRRRPGDGLRHRGRPGRGSGALHSDVPRDSGHADRCWPRRACACCRSNGRVKSACSGS